MKMHLKDYNASSEFEKISLGVKEKLVQSSEKEMELEGIWEKLQIFMML